MISLRGIDHVAVNVRDLDRSLQFYTGVLGLKISSREFSKPGIEYFLEAGPASLIGLIQGDPSGPEHLFQEKGTGANHFSFRIRAQDFDPSAEELRRRGIEPLVIKKREKSWSLYFHDPDGNKIELTAWPQEDGIL